MCYWRRRFPTSKCRLCTERISAGKLSPDDQARYRNSRACVGSKEIRLHDRVLNHGFCRTPHMYCYHINLGFPLLDENSLYLAPIEDVPWAAHAAKYEQQRVGYRTLAAPRTNFVEQVWEHWLGADAQGKVPVAVVNDDFDAGRGLGSLVETN